MNILLVYKEADIATYKMLEGLSKLEDFNIYIASPQSYTDKKIYGNCTPLDLPVITSKFNWNVIRALRQIIKTYQIDLIYSPSSSGLSNALFASIGTRAKNIAYRGTQAKLKRFDPTYYLGILNPAVEHVVCETKDIEEYLSRFIARKRLTTSTKPFDIDWIKEGNPYAQTSRRYSGRRLSLHLYRSDEEQAVQRLNRFDSCVYLIG